MTCSGYSFDTRFSSDIEVRAGRAGNSVDLGLVHTAVRRQTLVIFHVPTISFFVADVFDTTSWCPALTLPGPDIVVGPVFTSFIEEVESRVTGVI